MTILTVKLALFPSPIAQGDLPLKQVCGNVVPTSFDSVTVSVAREKSIAQLSYPDCTMST